MTLNLIGKGMILAMATSISFTTPTFASSVDAADVAVAAPVVVEGAREAAEMSILQKTIGRAGAAGNGLKGIVTEVMVEQKENISNIGKNVSTRFTKSSTATQSDLVTVRKTDGRIVKRIQVKDTPSKSGTAKTIKQVESGQYRGAKLVGTSESAEAFNAKAAKKGINVVMEDSGISTKTTARIASKGKGMITSEAAKLAGNAAGVGAIFGGAAGAYEAVSNGEDGYNVAAKTTTGAAKGAIACGTATLAGEAAAAGVAAVGMTGAAPVIIPAAVVIGGGIAAEAILDKGSESIDLDANVAKAYEVTTERACEAGGVIAEKTCEAGGVIAEKACEAGGVIAEKTCAAGGAIAEGTKNLTSTVATNASNIIAR